MRLWKEVSALVCPRVCVPVRVCVCLCDCTVLCVSLPGVMLVYLFSGIRCVFGEGRGWRLKCTSFFLCCGACYFSRGKEPCRLLMFSEGVCRCLRTRAFCVCVCVQVRLCVCVWVTLSHSDARGG